jgi:methylthioribose-1-phosphate isomerase
MSAFFTLRFQKDHLEILDQTRLPGEKKILCIRSAQEAIQAIKRLAVRGAPAIGVAGAYALILASREVGTSNFEVFLKAFLQKAREIAEARPTAVNLQWAVDRVVRKILRNSLSVSQARELVYQEAHLIHEEDRAMCLAIGRAGLPLIRKGDSILTHCNAGALATGGIGTALAPLYLAKKKGIKFHVFVDETRPLLQGARLTAWELKQAGIPHTLICDNMVGSLMARGEITKVITGADRIARNGDAANKIGTYGVAVLAKHHGIPFYIAAPRSTFDLKCTSGHSIPIEEREAHEVLGFKERQWAPDRTQVKNPAFDVTPHAFITAFITDQGLLKPPYSRSFRKLSV